MNLTFIEYQPQRVLAAFRQGDFDNLEVIGRADERDFFQRCFQERLLSALAASMPTARKKEEVPRWFILAACLSLKLHQENSFLAFERVARCGGLLSALPPDLAVKHLDAKTRQWVLECQGFNDRNSYDRQTPCDQDTLRKALKDVPAAQWMDWFNQPGQQSFQSYGFFDPEGIFIGDGSYLFVPDNPAYEGSAVLWFDEHNHPADYEKLSPPERTKAHRERCYKWVSLLHLRGGACVYAWTRLPQQAPVPGPIPPSRPPELVRREAKRQKTLAQKKQAAPAPPPEEVYTHTEHGWIGGFTSWTAATVPIAVVCLKDHYADGHHQDWALMTTSASAQPLRLLDLYRKRTAIEERHRQLKCFCDLSDFRSRSFDAIAAQAVMVLLTYTLRQWQLWKFLQETLANLTPEGLAAQLKLMQQWGVIYWGLAYTQLPVVSFTREAIQLEGMAKEKALRKLETLENALLTPLPNPRPM
jgi:hypothetical protein